MNIRFINFRLLQRDTDVSFRERYHVGMSAVTREFLESFITADFALQIATIWSVV